MAIHFGTCSWKYDSWEGIVYPEGQKYDFLTQYATHFDTVEVDQWFWSLFGVDKVKLPDEKTVTEYLHAVPKHFKFTIKVPNSITLTHFYTHGKPKGSPMEINPHFFSKSLMKQFLEKIAPLRERIGVLMFQFEYLNRQKMESQALFLQQFQKFLESSPPHYKYAVELRNPNYLNEPYFTFLNRFQLAHVFVQGYYMPLITQIYHKYAHFIQNLSVIRLMGTDRPGIEERAGNKWNKIVDNRDNELPDIVAILKALEAKNVTVFLNINNHYEGSAPLTIRKIQEIIKKK